MSARVPREERPGFPWYLLTGLLLGLILGLAYAWFVNPVSYVDASPAMLEATNRDFYRRLVALAYRANQDPGRALARLRLLGEENAPAALESLADQATGATSDETRALLELAQALRNTPQPTPTAPRARPTLVNTQTATSAPSSTITPTASITPTITRTPANKKTRTALTAAAKSRPSVTPTLAEPTETRTPQPSSTPRPSLTASVTPGAPFALAEKKDVCDAGAPTGLLQVKVEDSVGQPVPGVVITVLWGNSGQDRFYTGLAPEQNPGYADFVMTAGVVYSVRAGENGETVSDVRVPDCNGGVYLRFKQ